MKFTGICKAVLPQQSGQSQRTGQPWVSQEYVFEEEGQRFPQSMCARVFGADKIAEMNIQQGQRYDVDFDITTNQSQKTGGYFNSLNIYKVTPLGQGAVSAPPVQGGYQAPQQGFQVPPVQGGFAQPQGGQPQWGGQPAQGGYPQNDGFPPQGGQPNQGIPQGGGAFGGQQPPAVDANGNPLPF